MKYKSRNQEFATLENMQHAFGRTGWMPARGVQRAELHELISGTKD